MNADWPGLGSTRGAAEPAVACLRVEGLAVFYGAAQALDRRITLVEGKTMVMQGE